MVGEIRMDGILNKQADITMYVDTDDELINITLPEKLTVAVVNRQTPDMCAYYEFFQKGSSARRIMQIKETPV